MLAAILTFAVSVQSDPPPIRVTAIPVPPLLDGVLDEAVWRDATVVGGFIQRAPLDGAPSSERTEVLLGYTSATLYVGVRADDAQPDRIVATAMRRDDPALLENDQFAMAIDSYADGRNGFWFSTNALGVREDAQFFDEGAQWIDWNGDWQVRARRTPTGWSAEFAIPFATLRFRPDTVVTMGMNFFRRIIRTNELTFSPHIPLQYAEGTATVSVAHRFAFTGITGHSLGYVRPYGLAGVTGSDLSSASRADVTTAEVGGEARISISDNVTTTVSVNTDFAQVEVDDRQINLTRFDLFFPEKRQFFLEDGGLFAFGVPEEAEVFFSRRVGLARDSAGVLRAVPVRFGGKVVARAGRVELGALDMLTHGDDGGAMNFGVFRFKAGVAPKSYVGGQVTTAHGSDTREGTAGGDFTVYADGVTGVRGFAVTRMGTGVGESRRAASAYDLDLFRTGARFTATVGILEVGSSFLPASGFIARPGARRLTADVATPWYPSGGAVRRVEPRVTLREYRLLAGGVQSRTAMAQTTLDFRSLEQVTIGVVRSREAVDLPFEVFRGRPVAPGDYSGVEGVAGFTTNPGRVLSLGLDGRHGGWLGGRKTEVDAQVTWKTGRYLTVFQGYHLAAADLPAGRFTAHTARSRLDFALNTSFSVIGIAQYDNDSRQLGLNLRALYQYREGTEVHVVLNYQADRAGLDGRLLGRVRDRSVLVKLTYRLNL